MKKTLRHSTKEHIQCHITRIADLAGPFIKNGHCWDHGIDHLKQVAFLAGRLAAGMGECVESAVIGGYLHDSAREDDGGGNAHARASAAIARRIIEKHYRHLPIDRIEYAIHYHADGLVTHDALIGCIWDADRLTLGRIGIRVNPSKLSTRLARRFIRRQPR